MSEGGPLGYLVINVLEAAGHDSEDAVVWDPDLKQGYARGAFRVGLVAAGVKGRMHPVIKRSRACKHNEQGLVAASPDKAMNLVVANDALRRS